MGDYSPEKAGVGGSTPSLATIILNNLAAEGRDFRPTIQPTIPGFDPRVLKVKKIWPLSPCEEPVRGAVRARA
jgi:hypothetical protein